MDHSLLYEIVTFLIENKTEIAAQLIEEFKIQIKEMNTLKGFKRVSYTMGLKLKMASWIKTKHLNLDPEAFLLIDHEDKFNDALTEIYKEVL